MRVVSLFSVFDSRSDSFCTPFFESNNDLAIRAVLSLLREDSFIATFPHDFSLYHLGEFDYETGKLTPLDQPELILSSLDIVKEHKLIKEEFNRISDSWSKDSEEDN
jgi:hypothetical protein